MGGYSVFAQYYDALTENVEYPRCAEYLLRLMERLGHEPGLTLDLACGTGSLTLELFRRGVDIYGVDASVEMLSEAREKCAENGADILFLCQKMQSLDLYGTVDTVICSLDSINHLKDREEVAQAFSKVSFFMDPGGWFIFDLNTLYKHEKVLGNNTFVYDMERVYCVWQNSFLPNTGQVEIRMDFFERVGKEYHRSAERFFERAYPVEDIVDMLHSAGFDTIKIFDEMSFSPPRDDSQRLVFAAQKVKNI